MARILKTNSIFVVLCATAALNQYLSGCRRSSTEITLVYTSSNANEAQPRKTMTLGNREELVNKLFKVFMPTDRR
jgi:hypothetical protein